MTAILNPNLPDGITRSSDLQAFVTLDNCHALMFHFREDNSPADAMLSCVIVWKDRPSAVKPVEERKRLRDLRPGDRVTVFGKSATLVEVEIYR